jgi:hypothetical protein
LRATTDKTISSKDTMKQRPTFVGIDIDPDRIHIAQTAWFSAAHTKQNILRDIPYEFHIANAVLNDELWNDLSTTILYVYLTPRGMKHLKRQLLDGKVNNFLNGHHTSEQPKQRRVIVSYMNPFPETTFLRKEYVSIPHQPDTSYPIYIYEW